jgi:hypothetical protein
LTHMPEVTWKSQEMQITEPTRREFLAGVLGAVTHAPRPAGFGTSLTLVPPPPVTDRILLDMRAAIWNHAGRTQSFEVAIYLDNEQPHNLLHREKLKVPAQGAKGVFARSPTKGRAGKHTVLLKATSGRQSISQTAQIEILASEAPSTGRIEGSWISFNLPESRDSKHYDADLARMTDDQWKELVHGMAEVGMNVIVIQETVHNYIHVGEHNMERDGYQGKAFYPSKQHLRRMPMQATDPVEAVFAEADRLGLNVFQGVGVYAWFDFTPASLTWHKELASELWSRYGHHPSFYGWYVGEEVCGQLACLAKPNPPLETKRHEEIVEFFREFQAHCRSLAPDKPVMLASNSFWVARAMNIYPSLLAHCDILAPFGFHRMPVGDLTGEEAASMLQELCDQAGARLWLDLEVFDFDKGGALIPRSIEGITSDLKRFPSFEKILCYQYPGLMSAPWASIHPGGPQAVKLFGDYKAFLSR